ncbi:sensor histidine kinase [Paraburkholderia bannensis]|uniref:sensor histidine kinase n=1 Tax=Paraburkholderia bannensis TaxID=765414 RepID=UPI002AC3590F|nr:ATP-binding protein [Paraburkholderia bannensis]
MFARIVLLSIASLMLAQISFPYFGTAGSPGLSSKLSLDSASAVSSAWQDDDDIGLSADDARPHGIAPHVSIHPRFADLRDEVAPHLRDAIWAPDVSTHWNPSFTHDSDTHWIGARILAQVAAAYALLAGLLFALRSWWRREVRDDLQQLSAMLRKSSAAIGDAPEFTPGHRRELHDLARTLGDLVCRRNGAAEDESRTFTAFLKLIEARAARLRAIATNITGWNLRVTLIEDIDLFHDVARQFGDAAGLNENDTTPVSVDAYLKDRFHYGVNADDSRIVLRLQAGEAFELPRAALVRLIDNLVGNALAHGAPPVEIGTARTARNWTLSVRDHGAGGAERLQENARMSPSRASQAAGRDMGAHWGIGLSIVGRLAQRCNATLKIGDHPEGGLCVRVVVATNDGPAQLIQQHALSAKRH